MIYILDIETKPKAEHVDTFMSGIKAPGNYKDAEKIQQYIAIERQKAYKKMSCDTDYAEPYIVGLKEVGKEGQIVSVSELGKLLLDDPYFHLITFNGKKFDIPILIKYGIANGIDMPYKELLASCRRYDKDRQIDMMEVLGFGDMRSLDTYAKIYLNKQKKEVDFEKVTHDELVEHCLEDLSITEELYLMFKDLV